MEPALPPGYTEQSTTPVVHVNFHAQISAARAPAGSAAGCGGRQMTGSCPRSAGLTCTTCARYPSTAAAGSSRAGMMSDAGKGDPNAKKPAHPVDWGGRAVLMGIPHRDSSQGFPGRRISLRIVPRWWQRSLALCLALDLAPAAHRPIIPQWSPGHASIRVRTSLACPSAAAARL